MTDEGNRGAGGMRALMWLAIAVAIALLIPLRQSGVSVQVYGVEMAVWVVAIVFYLIGLAAGWAAFKARRG